jgi:hypothetical protein
MESLSKFQLAPGVAIRRSEWRTQRAALSLLVLGATLAWLGMLPRLGATPPAALPQVDVAISTKSIFTDDPKFGKDPFFPHSIRRGTAELVNPNVPLTDVRDLVLKGISGGKDRRLAMINNRTVENGEELDFKFGSRTVKVHCVEIREKSVVIRVDGQSKELFLRQNL